MRKYSVLPLLRPRNFRTCHSRFREVFSHLGIFGLKVRSFLLGFFILGTFLGGSSINSAGTFGSCSQANVYDRTVCAMKLPLAGLRSWYDGQYYSQGDSGLYWSSSLFSSNAYDAAFWSGAGNVADVNNRASGYSLRCVKD